MKKIIFFVCICLSLVAQGQNLSIGINPNAIKKDIIVPEHGMADPHAWVQNDTVFVICGHDQSWDAVGSFPMDRWEVWSSVDLINWNYHRSIFPADTYIGDLPNCWAGDVCERNGKYYWFFSNRNINTGVMVANKIDGPYTDLLGKPLLSEGIVPVHAYDPALFIENGVYTICFGHGTYYMATLSEDMKSITNEPTPISVVDANGNKVYTDDKSTLFKRGNWCYLVYGSKYAMSKNLYGPYDFKGAFLEGGHTSFFQWKNQWYVLQENHDISAFYRGASLKPVFFNEDATVIIPKDDRMYPGPGRDWAFVNSTMGWKSLNNTTVTHLQDGGISGVLSGKNATLVSAPWLYTDTRLCTKMSITLKNNSSAKYIKLAIYTRDEKEKNFWASDNKPIDWGKQEWVTIPIVSNTKEFKTYTVDLSLFKQVKSRLMRVALQPASDAPKGTWELANVNIK